MCSYRSILYFCGALNYFLALAKLGFVPIAGVSVIVNGFVDAKGSVGTPAVLRTTFEDHSPRQAVASCKTHCLLFFLGEDTLVNTHFAAPILRAPLLTDTRWSTVGPGTRGRCPVLPGSHHKLGSWIMHQMKRCHGAARDLSGFIRGVSGLWLMGSYSVVKMRGGRVAIGMVSSELVGGTLGSCCVR